MFQWDFTRPIPSHTPPFLPLHPIPALPILSPTSLFPLSTWGFVTLGPFPSHVRMLLVQNPPLSLVSSLDPSVGLNPVPPVQWLTPEPSTWKKVFPEGGGSKEHGAHREVRGVALGSLPRRVTIPWDEGRRCPVGRRGTRLCPPALGRRPSTAGPSRLRPPPRRRCPGPGRRPDRPVTGSDGEGEGRDYPGDSRRLTTEGGKVVSPGGVPHPLERGTPCQYLMERNPHTSSETVGVVCQRGSRRWSVSVHKGTTSSTPGSGSLPSTQWVPLSRRCSLNLNFGPRPR